MTLIVATPHLMIADGGYFSGNLKFGGPRKIIRLPDGSLFGCTGASSAVRAIHEWASAEAIAEATFGVMVPFPALKWSELDKLDHGEALTWLWLHLDGRCQRGDELGNWYYDDTPAMAGVDTAAKVWLGAYKALTSMNSLGAAYAAMEIAVQHSCFIDNPIQIEYLKP